MENYENRSVSSDPFFSLSEITDALRAWTNLDAEPEDEDERVVQRTCRRLVSMFEQMAKSKKNTATGIGMGQKTEFVGWGPLEVVDLAFATVLSNPTDITICKLGKRDDRDMMFVSSVIRRAITKKISNKTV